MLSKITQRILTQIPETVKYKGTEKEIISKHKDFILENTSEIVTSFYDTMYYSKETKTIFNKGERPIREKSMNDWLSKIFEEQTEDDFWEGQTFAGIMHIKRGISNNMLTSMLNHVSNILIEKATLHLVREEAIALLKAWIKLSGMIAAFIAEGYQLFYLQAVENVTGLSATLLNNTVKDEFDNLISSNQLQLVR